MLFRKTMWKMDKESEPRSRKKLPTSVVTQVRGDKNRKCGSEVEGNRFKRFFRRENYQFLGIKYKWLVCENPGLKN